MRGRKRRCRRVRPGICGLIVAAVWNLAPAAVSAQDSHYWTEQFRSVTNVSIGVEQRLSRGRRLYGSFWTDCNRGGLERLPRHDMR